MYRRKIDDYNPKTNLNLKSPDEKYDAISYNSKRFSSLYKSEIGGSYPSLYTSPKDKHDHDYGRLAHSPYSAYKSSSFYKI